MPLDTAQRQFVEGILKLGSTSRLARLFRSSGDNDLDDRLRAALTTYADEEKKAATALKDFVVPGSASPAALNYIAHLKTSLDEALESLRTTTRLNGERDVDAATKGVKKLVESLNSSKIDLETHASKLPDATKDVDDASKKLAEAKKKKYAAHVADEIAAAEAKLDTSRHDLQYGKFDEAKVAAAASQVDATTAITNSTTYETKIAALEKKTAGTINSFGNNFDKTALDALKKSLADARKAYAFGTRDYVTAETELDGAFIKLTAKAEAYRQHGQNGLKAVEAKNTSATAETKLLLAADLKAIQDRYADIATAKTNEEYAALFLAWRVNLSAIKALTYVYDRRAGYDAAVAGIEAKIVTLKSDGTTAPATIVDVETQLADNKNAAKASGNRIEEAQAAAAGIDNRCAALIALKPKVEAYKVEYPKVETKVNDVVSRATAPNLAGDVQALKDGLAQWPALVGALADMANGSDKPEWWDKAMQGLAHVKANAERIEALVTGFAEIDAQATEVEAGKDDAGRLTGVLTQLTLLKERATTAHPKATENLGQVAQVRLDIAKLALEEKPPNLDGAAKALSAATTAVTTLTRLATDAQAFDKEIGLLETELSTITPVKPGKNITDRIKGLTGSTAGAKNVAAGGNIVRAYELLAEIQALVATLKVDIVALKDANKEQADLESDVAPLLLDKKHKTAVERLLLPIEAAIDDGKFAAAQDLIDKAYTAVAKIRIDAEAAKGATASAVTMETLAEAFMKRKSGPKALDDLVKNLPSDVPGDIVAKIINKRFGVPCTLEDVKSVDGNKSKSGKKIYEMLAMVPSHVKGNPSLSKIERTNSDKSGGSFSPSTKEVDIQGRPGQQEQKFGKNISGELPKNIVTECEPKDSTAVDYFNFATLHEVGHAVDDRLGYMEKNQSASNHGGWQLHHKIDDIATAVAGHYAFAGTAEQTNWVRDLFLRKEPDDLTPPTGQETAWIAAMKNIKEWFATATGGQIWWSDKDSTAIAIGGRVYQEAYPNSWVSYELAARKRGITGYQFRAPGEWFSELYASYHSGKLKDSHPSVTWLKTL